MIKRLLFSLVLIASFANYTALAQPPFYSSIQEFKRKDSAAFPPKKAILFIGSSSFTNWKDVQEYFPDRTIINRAFGGSSLPHLTYYANDIIFPYKPKQIVIYCGDNDLASSDTIQPQHVLQRFETLFNLIRSRDRKVRISYVSIKPSIARIKLMGKMEESNRLVKDFLAQKKRTDFIDIYHPMLASNGGPEPSIFLKDSLHMNKQGYAIWQQKIEPYLIKR